MTAAFLALAQTIPTTASVVYPCLPESAVAGSVHMVTHSATYKIDLKTQKFESLSTFRNGTDAPVNVVLRLPLRGKQVTWAQSKGMHLSAMVNKQKVTLNEGQATRSEPTEKQKASGIWAQSYEKFYTVNLSFKPKETKSLQVFFESALCRAGMDGAQRMVVYDTAGADTWADKIKQFNYAIQYSNKVVLQVYASLPEGNWQIGPTGAFMKFYDFEPAEKPHFIFTFYPNSFESIGGG
ncbi:MAG: hypothetical protein ABL949_12220 [Fimbriimonadaceae bacterium]